MPAVSCWILFASSRLIVHSVRCWLVFAQRAGRLRSLPRRHVFCFWLFNVLFVQQRSIQRVWQLQLSDLRIVTGACCTWELRSHPYFRKQKWQQQFLCAAQHIFGFALPALYQQLMSQCAEWQLQEPTANLQRVGYLIVPHHRAHGSAESTTYWAT